MTTREDATPVDGDEASCPICLRGEPLDVLVELTSTWVTAGREAALPGYVCVVSKVHVSEPFELRGGLRGAFWDEVSDVAEAIKAATGSPKLNYEIHGNTIPHLHVHVYPRFPGDPYQGRAIDPRPESVFERSDADLGALGDAIRAWRRMTSTGPG